MPDIPNTTDITFAPGVDDPMSDAAMSRAIQDAVELAGFSVDRVQRVAVPGGATKAIVVATNRATGVVYGFALMPDPELGRLDIVGLPLDVDAQSSAPVVSAGFIEYELKGARC